VLRKENKETCLNGKSPTFFLLNSKEKCKNTNKSQDNSVSNQIQSTFLLLCSKFRVVRILTQKIQLKKKLITTNASIIETQLLCKKENNKEDKEDNNFNNSKTSVLQKQKIQQAFPVGVSTQQKKPIPPITPRCQPGIYMIRCKINDKRYYGETSNISGRLASHKSQLNKNIHNHKEMQHDWITYGEEYFDFVILFMGPEWVDRKKRIKKETLLIVQDSDLCYNYLIGISKFGEKNPFFGKKHTELTKEKIALSMPDRPNDLLGKPLQLNGILYPSLAEASRATGMARKTIRKRLNDPNDNTCVEIKK